MSKSNVIDERVVEMRFDNKQFESNVKESMSTIDKFKKSLDFSKTSSSISAFEVASITAIANISNRITDLGINLIKSLSVDNIAAGWQKYNDEVRATGTLMSQGIADETTINKQLEVLQFFADETSYSFDSMYDSVTKFTASGVGLEESVTAVEGIAIWAAKAGQNSQTASNAMYQLSQAVSAGTVRLQDYRSIQTANMDTQEFRKTVLETAAAMGELYETSTGKYITKKGTVFDAATGFTESLSENWFSKDVLMKTLGKYSKSVTEVYNYIENQAEMGVAVTASDAIDKLSGSLDEFSLSGFEAAQEARTLRDAIDSVKEATASGWKRIFKNVFGDYKESKKLWTNFANELWEVFVDPLNEVSAVLKKWKEFGGIDDLFERTEETSGAFWNLFDAIIAVKNAVAKAWREVFPIKDLKEGESETDAIARNLKSITENINEFTSKLILSEKNAQTVTNIFKGFFAILKGIKDVISAIWTIIKPILSVGFDIFGELASWLGEITGKLADIISQSTFLKDLADNIAKGIRTFVDGIKDIFSGKKIEDTSDEVIDTAEKVEDTVEKVGETAETAKKVVDTVLETTQTIGTKVKKTFMSISDWVNEKVTPAIKSITDYIKDTIWPEFVDTLSSIWKWLKEKIWPLVERIWPIVKKIFETLGNILADDVLPAVLDILTTLVDVFGPLIKNLVYTGTKIIESFLHSLERYQPAFDALALAFENIFNTIADIFYDFSTSFMALSVNLADGIDEEEEKNIKNILKVIGLIAGIVLGLFVMGRTVDRVRAIFQPIQYFQESLSDFLWNIGSAAKFAALGYLLKGLADLALAIAGLSIVTASDVKTGALIIGGIILAISVLALGLKKILFTGGELLGSATSAKEAISIAAVIASVSSIIYSMKELAIALVMLSEIDPTQLENAAIAIIAIVAVVMVLAGVVAWLCGGKSGSSFSRNISGGIGKGFNFSNSRSTSLAQDALNNVVKIGLALLVMALALVLISKIPEEKLNRSLHVLGVLAVTLFGFVAVISIISIFAKNNGAAGNAIKSTFSLALSLLILTGVVAILGNMDEEVFTKGSECLKKLMLYLLVFDGVISFINIFAKQEKAAAKSIRSLFSLSLTLLVLTGTLYLLQTYIPDWDPIYKLGVMIAGLGAFLVGVAFIAKYVANSEKNIKRIDSLLWSLTIFALDLAILGVVAYGLTYVEWESLGKLGAMVIALAGLLVGIGFIVKKVVTTKDMVTRLTGMMSSLLLFTTSVILLCAVAYGLTYVEWESLGKLGAMVIALAGLLVGIGFISKLIIKDAEQTMRATTSIIMLMIFVSEIAILGAIANALTYVDWNGLGKLGTIAGGLLLSLLAIVGISKIIGENGISKAILALVLLGIFIVEFAELAWAFGLLLPVLKDLGNNAAAINKGLGSLGILAGGMVAIAAIFGALVYAGGIGAVMLAMLGIFIVEFAELGWALGKLLPVLKELGANAKVIDQGLGSLLKIVVGMVAVGVLFGALTYAMGAGAVMLAMLGIFIAEIAELAWALSVKGGLASIFSEWGDESVAKGIENFATLLRILTLTSFVSLAAVLPNALQFLTLGLLTISLKGLGSRLKEIGEGLSTISKVNARDLLSTTTVFEGLIEHFNVFNTLFKRSVFDKINDALHSFADGMGAIFGIDITSEKLLAVNEAIILLKNMVSEFGSNGGWFSNLFGASEYAKASNNLSKISKGIKTFVKEINDIKLDSDITVILNLINSLSRIIDISDSETHMYFQSLPLGYAIIAGIIDGAIDNKSYMLEQFKDFFADLFIDIQNILNEMDSPTITITPVIDMSAIQSQLSTINTGTYSINGSNYVAERTSREFLNSRNDSGRVNSVKTAASTGDVINNTFNITGSNAKEIADEVNIRLQKQVNRRNAKWGL